ncbi:ricin B lectin domain-containing protein [Mycena pura]|uniref:Ricin B lectin domain-containing protein n=1 Tax=Mycena pura TaxID=153505 RepID=A0AAD6UWP8_9AGAR|nr:ricin B lectin domain-containing protein [Mycena pura]
MAKFLVSAFVAASVANVAFASTLRACLDLLPIGGINFPLSHGIRNGPFVECEYHHAFAGPQFCFYNATSLALTHAPNVPPATDTTLPVDSNAACPTQLPLAGSYRINFPDTNPDGTFKCVTMSDDSDGAPVVIQDCDFAGPSNQVWSFVGSTIRQGDKCLDVTDGQNVDGVKLQVWTCVDGNTNQEFQHSGGAILNQPNDIIEWLTHPNKCMDLTDGDETNGNQIQMWTCFSGNTNQMWAIGQA